MGGRATKVTCPGVYRPGVHASSLHVTRILGGDWSTRGTWAGVARGGAGDGGGGVGLGAELEGVGSARGPLAPDK